MSGRVASPHGGGERGQVHPLLGVKFVCEINAYYAWKPWGPTCAGVCMPFVSLRPTKIEHECPRHTHISRINVF